MPFQNSILIAAPRDKVWAFLLDPHAFRACVPGLDEIKVYEPGRAFGGIAAFRLGSNQLRFPIQVQWLEQRSLEGGQLQAHARLADYNLEAVGEIALHPVDEVNTEIKWGAKFTPPPELEENQLLFQMGQNAALKIIKSFFKCLQARLETA